MGHKMFKASQQEIVVSFSSAYKNIKYCKNSQGTNSAANETTTKQKKNDAIPMER